MTTEALLESLNAALGDSIALLSTYGEHTWVKWLERDQALLSTGNLRAVEHLLSAFGGMGSLNDLYICPENKHVIAAGDVEAVNDNLRRLSSQVYSIAVEVKRSAAL